MKEYKNTDVQKVRFKDGLRNLKDQAHFFFDQLWKLKYLTREEAYAWLAKQLGVEEPQAHMSKMSEDMCRQVIENAVMILNDLRRLNLDWNDPIHHPYYELIIIKKESKPVPSFNWATNQYELAGVAVVIPLQIQKQNDANDGNKQS